MAEDRTLLQSQKNKVAELFIAAGLPRSAFTWLSYRTRSDLLVSRLEHSGSRFFYLFDYRWNSEQEIEFPVAEYSPGDSDRTVVAWLPGWAEHAEHLDAWVTNLRRELEAPDLWSAGKELASEIADIERNDPFTASERELISESIRSLRRRVDETFELTTTQAEIVAARLTYLEAAAGRVGRFDWRGLVVSVIWGVAWDMAFNPEQTRQLVGFFIDAFGGLIQALPRLPH